MLSSSTARRALPLPDLLSGAYELRFIALEIQAQGPLTAEFGVPEGTPGRCKISRTGLFMTHGKGVALEEGFPAEQIKVQVIGK